MSSPLQNNITNLQNLLDKVNSLPEAGTDLPELTNPADASKALSGYEFINEDGEKVTGTIPTKTASDLTASGATVTIPSGYYASQATKSVATATQATPSVSIDSAGKITATATQTAGYVTAGTKTGTKQLTTQAAKTVTPSTSSQTAVAKNVYTTGAVTVAAIPSKYVDNSTVTAVESDVMSGKKFGASGGVKTGTFSLDSELSTQDDLIAQIQTALEGKAAGGSGSGSAEVFNIKIQGMVSGAYYLNTSNNLVAITEEGTYAVNYGIIMHNSNASPMVDAEHVYTPLGSGCFLKLDSDGFISFVP